MTEIVDTNVILRYLVGDDKKQKDRAKKWFKEAQAGKRKLAISPLVIAECCFVLESFYGQDREKIARVFESFLSQRWFKIDERKTLLALWKWYKKGLHFVDSFLLSWAKISGFGILSFDKELVQKERK